MGAVTALICLDILCYSFPLPFMPEFLASRGHTARETSVLLSSFSFAAFASGATIVVAQSALPARGGDAVRRRCALLAVAAMAMAAVSAVQAALPSYGALVVARSLQGAISQLSWSVGLALAVSLPPCAGVAATAWAMTGNSVGEVAGPLYGAALHSLGGLRLPYMGAAVLCALISLAFVATAVVGAPAADEAAEAGGGGGAVAAAGTAGTAGAAGGAVGELSRAQPWGGALRDGPTWRLCAFQALCCGTVRSCLDILMPLWLRSHHGFSTVGIGRCSCVATLCFLLGSATAGRLLPLRPAATEPLLLGAGLLASLLCASVLLSPSWVGVCAVFSAYYFVSAFVGLAATTALEKRGRQIGHTDGVMALSVFLWTSGFAGGGAMANLACGGVASAARQRGVLAAVGAATAAICVFSLPGGGGEAAPMKAS